MEGATAPFFFYRGGDTVEDLFTSGPYVGKPWIDQISTGCRARCEEVADLIIKYGREPSWVAVYKRLKEEFPVDVGSDTTVRNTIRHLVEQRGG